MSNVSDSETRFCNYLNSLAEDENRRHALASLRRGLGKSPGEAPAMFPYIVPWLPRDESAPDEEAYYLISSLFASHPQPWRSAEDSPRETNLGASLANLSHFMQGGGLERRFVALLNAGRRDLSDHLRHAVALCKAHDVPIDWAQLLHDVKRWETTQHWSQRRWARAFWSAGDAGPSLEVQPDS